MSKFQVTVIAIFIICIIAGVATFAFYRGGSDSTDLPTIVVWGTFPSVVLEDYISDINNKTVQGLSVKYVQKKPDVFNKEFISALARGNGPDAILIPSDMLLSVQDKVMLIPYSAFPRGSYMKEYISEATIYLTESGIMAIPFSIDPMVMYWNKDMFNAAGIATYPKYWDEFTGTAKTTGINSKLTVKDDNGNLKKSAIAMGDFSNIVNARETLGTLLMQIGNPITVNTVDGPVSTLKINSTSSAVPAVDFFSQFADPTNVNYSWNRGQQQDKTAFLAGNLATYFGFASELADLREKNPNLNFDVAPMPQIRDYQPVTYGRIYGFSIIKNAVDANAAYQTVSVLASDPNLSALANKMYLPKVLISDDRNFADPYLDSFNKAALISKTWLDANPARSREIMANMIQTIISGQMNSSRAVQNAGDEYDHMLKEELQ